VQKSPATRRPKSANHAEESPTCCFETMQIAPLPPRAVPIPARHFLLAVGIAAALGFGACWWSRSLPVEYVSSALLSYGTTHDFLRDSANAEGNPPVTRIVESVLSPQTLLRIADQVQFPPNPSAAARSADFHSHLEFVQPAAGLLQVSYHGMDGRQAVAATNAVAGALAAWAPRPARAPGDASAAVAAKVPSTTPALAEDSPPVTQAATATPPVDTGLAQGHQATELRRRAATLEKDNARLSPKLQNIERQIRDLTDEEKSLEGSLSRFPTGAAAKRSRLAAVVRQLGPLRLRRGMLETHIVSQEQQIRSLRARAVAIERRSTVATAAPVPGPPVEQPVPTVTVPRSNPDSTQQPTWQGTFSVMAWGEKPLPLGDARKKFVLWSGLAAGIAAAAFYLALVAWRSWRVT
jgi:hypothetical protein